jgi:beta-galactosidase
MAIPAVTNSGEVVGAGFGWIDQLEPRESTETQLRLDHPFFGEFSALSKTKVGKGTVHYLAVYPDAQLAKYIGAELVKLIGFEAPATATTESVIINRAKTTDGRTVYFVFNWGWQPALVNFKVAVEGVLSGEDAQVLGAWDIQVFVSK